MALSIEQKVDKRLRDIEVKGRHRELTGILSENSSNLKKLVVLLNEIKDAEKSVDVDTSSLESLVKNLTTEIKESNRLLSQSLIKEFTREAKETNKLLAEIKKQDKDIEVKVDIT